MNNCFTCLVKSKPVKQEVSCTVRLPPYGECSLNKLIEISLTSTFEKLNKGYNRSRFESLTSLWRHHCLVPFRPIPPPRCRRRHIQWRHLHYLWRHFLFRWRHIHCIRHCLLRRYFLYPWGHFFFRWHHIHFLRHYLHWRHFLHLWRHFQWRHLSVVLEAVRCWLSTPFNIFSWKGMAKISSSIISFKTRANEKWHS